MKKLSNTEAELKKSVAYKKSMYLNLIIDGEAGEGLSFLLLELLKYLW